MKKVHCRKCWQPISLLTMRCAQCGDFDSRRIRYGVFEVLLYVAAGAVAIGLGWWAVSSLVHSSSRITHLTELESATRSGGSEAAKLGCLAAMSGLEEQGNSLFIPVVPHVRA